MSQADRVPAPDPAGELFLGPLAQGKDTYVLMSREVVHHLESSGHEFWQFDHEARLLAHWRPRFDSDCEYALRTEYEIRDFTLLQLNGRRNDSRVDDDWHWDVRVILNVSKRLDPDGPEARALAAAIERSRTV